MATPILQVLLYTNLMLTAENAANPGRRAFANGGTATRTVYSEGLGRAVPPTSMLCRTTKSNEAKHNIAGPHSVLREQNRGGVGHRGCMLLINNSGEAMLDGV